MQAEPYLTAYYNTYDEHSRLASRHGGVEFATTIHYITRYLRPGMRILEIGAGTGRYSHALARVGYAVDAVELVPHNIGIFRQNTQPGERITVVQGDATALQGFADDTYDITLLLGPMYHLFTPAHRHAALGEAIRVTKGGGVVFAAYCMADPSILLYGFARGNIQQLIADDMLDDTTFVPKCRPADLFALYRTEEIEALRACFAVTPLHFLAADGYANHMKAVVDAMDDATYALYLRYHLAMCERRDMLGLSHHTLDIFRKN